MIQMIVEIDENASFSEMPEDQQKAISGLNIQWPESQMIGTKAVGGRKLILILSPVDGATLENYMNVEYVSGNDENGDPIIHNFGLNWNVLAEEGVKVNQDLLLPYFEPELVFSQDENGEPVSESVPITDLTNKLQVYAGKKWLY